MSPRRRKQGHGSRSQYTAGCRCGPCVAANTAYMTQWRRARGVEPFRASELVHGTWAGYKTYRCRCDVCRAFNAAWYRGYRRRRRERAEAST